MNSEQKPILELSTAALPPRRKVSIDGEMFEIAHLDELSMTDRFSIDKTCSMLRGLASLSDEDISVAIKGLNRCFTRILLAPPEIKEKISEGQRLQILILLLSGGE